MDAQSRFLDAKEAARELTISTATLAKWRVYGIGPAFRKIGRRVIYDRNDIRTWLDTKRHLSTSEYGDA